MKHFSTSVQIEKKDLKALHYFSVGTTEPSSLSSQRVTAKETIVTGNANLKNTRSSKADWMIYILFITSCFFLTGFCHLFRTYRKRRSLEVRIINENVASESFTLCMGDNNEDDKKPLTFVKTGSLHTHKTSNNETINFVFNDEESNTAGNEHDEADYFDIYFAIGKISITKQKLKHRKNIQIHVKFLLLFISVSPVLHWTSISGWIIVTLCIAGCIILTGLGYLIRTYRQRLSVKSRIINEGAILEPLGPAPYIGAYDEIDENPLTFDTTDSNVTPQEPHYETVDCVFQERLSITTSTEHEDTGYLDPYFAIEDESDKLQDRTSQTECSSTNSFNSDVVDQDIIAYKNIYQPLQENWQDNSHGYEIPVMVHEGFECSAGFDENTISNSYYNVYKPLQKNMDIMNTTYENQKSPETKAGNDKSFWGCLFI
ncbi:unnamed protein product [Mytilus edulis]|uniref:Uncharacterized protein n=1 Tax=Mytilus edulis TaxID=6550 RepID=A0A8S3PR09_MYTED|nr:unnamed protein product [Mytilus edulis]